MAASIGGTEHAGVPDERARRAVGTTTMPAAARYSRAGEPRGSGAAAGRGCPSSSSAPVIARISMPPLPRTSASSSEPREQLRQRGRAGLADDDAVDVVLARVRQDLLGDALPAQRDGAPAELLGELERPQDVLALRALSRWSRGVSTCTAIHSACSPRGHAPRRPDEPAGAGARADAHQQPLARRPGLADSLLGHVAAHLRVHPLGRAAERQLAQRDQVALPEEALDRAARLLGDVDLPLAQPLLQDVGRDVHQLDLVGPLEHGVGNRLAHLHAGDRRRPRRSGSRCAGC